MSTYLATWAVGEFEFVLFLFHLSPISDLPSSQIHLFFLHLSSDERDRSPQRLRLEIGWSPREGSRSAGAGHARGCHAGVREGNYCVSIPLSRTPTYSKRLQLFDIPYELGKLDILVCDEFDAGAMEGYGLCVSSSDAHLPPAHAQPLAGSPAAPLPCFTTRLSTVLRQCSVLSVPFRTRRRTCTSATS
jgi:hypothetical protein